MASDKKVKCPSCEIFFKRSEEDYIEFKNRYWHKSCYENYLNSLNQEEKDLIDLENYIKELFHIEKITTNIRRQINKFIREGATQQGILNSLIYFYDIKHNTTEKSNGGIGIVPYVYKEAQSYFGKLDSITEKNKNKIIEDYTSGEREVVYIPKKEKNNFKLVDFDKLEEEIKCRVTKSL